VNYAISIKQPWATLVAHGLKTIDVRRWSTRRRGRVLIHAGRVADARPETWAHVPAYLRETAKQRGGIVGEAQVVDCRTYKTPETFAHDQCLHFNNPAWFQKPAMYGFVFAQARPLPFHRCSGSLYFFEVENAPPSPPPPAGLLVSVRNAPEAVAALEGGADLIDIKEPRNGALGPANPEMVKEIVRIIGGRKPVSAALGELAEVDEADVLEGLAYVKCGLAKMGRKKDWQRRLLAFRRRIARKPNAPELVTVAYADWKRACAPHWQDVAKLALRQRGGVLLVDTFDKMWQPPGNSQRPASLLDWMKVEELRRLSHQCYTAGVRIALAGSLRLRQIVSLVELRPTWFAVRGAVCESNKRDGEVHGLKVADLAQVLRWYQQPASVESSAS